MNSNATNPGTFADLGLEASVLQALVDVGYESPTPIQAATIPALLSGSDVLGQAQTGTGKTAAFALPLLSRLDLRQRSPQALVLVPTRELAIQVAEAFQKYAVHLPGFHVLPIYGGQSYTPQLNALRRGVHVVVGTPGRIMDHLERATLSLEGIRFVVLDEADEMLQMGFIDAIDAILARTPTMKQVALFSATIAPPIRQISQRHLRSPREITIKGKTGAAASTRQRYWLVSGMHKLDALTRILEVEPFDAMLVFARTKQSTTELAERLSARGFAAAALHGDIQQAQRERTVAQFKAGAIDILVATDVAARGLDVDRISHVLNFDVPHDTESYVHRIGRTGRAGRKGEAILFIAPRERNMLRIIERATRGSIEPMHLPTVEDVNKRRVDQFKQRLGATLASGAAASYRTLIEEFVQEGEVDIVDVAAALAHLAQGDKPLVLSSKPAAAAVATHELARAQGPPREARALSSRGEAAADRPGHSRKRGRFGPQETYRLAVGRAHGAHAGSIVGAIANEADLDGSQINGVEVCEDHSFVRLPADVPRETLDRLARVRVRGQELALTRVERRARAKKSHRVRSHRGREFK
jgi:ATP-dependent RNA helicase DeaD